MTDSSSPQAAHGELSGIRVLTLESRRAPEIAAMLHRHGAVVTSAPALREIPLSDSPAVFDLLTRLDRREIDLILLLTGVGTTALFAAACTRYPPERVRELLGSVPLVARGPKPVAALRAVGLTAALRVPEPNTWHEILATLDRERPVAGLRIAIQEYGMPNLELIEGLRSRGAELLRVPVYRWALPLDLGPLQAGIAALELGQVDVVVLTTAIQLEHLLTAAGPRAPAVLARMRSGCVVASIGPLCSQALAREGVPVHVEPGSPKLGPLVAAIAARAPALVAARRDR